MVQAKEKSSKSAEPTTTDAKKSAGRSVSSPRLVMDAIMRGIDAGRFVPGQRLIEADLTRELKVSRGPVREAFKRLAGEGVLTLNRHRGAYIRALNREGVRDTLLVLEVITSLAAKLAARHIDEGDNREWFQEAYDRLMAHANQGETLQFLAERRRFYDTLSRIAGNRELQRIMPHMQISLLRLQFQSYITPKQHQYQVQELQAIARAVLEGDAKRAERATKTHLRRRRVSLINLPDEAYAAAER